MRNFLKSVLLAKVAACVIVVVLNFVLLINQPNCANVIQPNTPSALWLTFWGALLAAVGSFIMAWVSYQQTSQQSKMREIEIKIQQAENQYNDLEQFILEVEQVHAWSNIENIILSDGNVYVQKSNWEIQLQKVSNKIVRYTSLFNDCKFRQYGNAVARMNKFCFAILDPSEARKGIHNQVDIHSTLMKVIFQLDTEILQQEQNKIVELYKQLELLNKKN